MGRSKVLAAGIDEDELCSICNLNELGADACSRLSCGHVFHTGCLVQLLKQRWPTKRITFGFMACPKCNEEIYFEGLSEPIAKELFPLLRLKEQVENLALKAALKHGIIKSTRLFGLSDVFCKNR